MGLRYEAYGDCMVMTGTVAVKARVVASSEIGQLATVYQARIWGESQRMQTIFYQSDWLMA